MRTSPAPSRYSGRSAAAGAHVAGRGHRPTPHLAPPAPPAPWIKGCRQLGGPRGRRAPPRCRTRTPFDFPSPSSLLRAAILMSPARLVGLQADGIASHPHASRRSSPPRIGRHPPPHIDCRPSPRQRPPPLSGSWVTLSPPPVSESFHRFCLIRTSPPTVPPGSDIPHCSPLAR
jgi:hypothetical protein